MSVVQFHCPSCQAPLRLENRALFVGRSFDCPDCGGSLLIEADGLSGVTAKPSHPTTRSVSEGPQRRASLQTANKVLDLGVDLQSPMSVWDRLSRRPALLGWIVAALLAVMFLVIVNSGNNRTPSKVAPLITAEKPETDVASQETAEQNSKTALEPKPSLPKDNAESPDAARSELPQAEDNPVSPQTEVAAEASRDNKPPAEAVPGEKPAAEEPKPVPIPPAPDPAPKTLSPEAVEAKLQQKVVRFEQSKPVPFIKVLDTVEELAGVPIVWDLDRVDEQQLQKPVTLHLKQTTVAEILDALLRQVGLERRTVEGKIELRPIVQKD